MGDSLPPEWEDLLRRWFKVHPGSSWSVHSKCLPLCVPWLSHFSCHHDKMPDRGDLGEEGLFWSSVLEHLYLDGSTVSPKQRPQLLSKKSSV